MATIIASPAPSLEGSPGDDQCTLSFNAHLPHLGEIGQALEHLAGAVLLQGAHPLVDGGPPDLLHVGPVQDEFLDLLGGDEELMDADPAAVAGVVALLAATTAVGGNPNRAKEFSPPWPGLRAPQWLRYEGLNGGVADAP